jgi:hypothetical protein
MTYLAEREYRHIDKSTWGEGPWQAEPDKCQWIDEASGLDCLAVRVPWGGSWCGYVGVPEGHPAFGRGYEEVDVEVHGGLTFAGPCQEGENAEEHGICHIPLPGRPERVWWQGFDCAHAGDIMPGMDAALRAHGSQPVRYGGCSGYPEDEYRTLEYVQAQCAHLAEQVQRLARPEEE